VVCTGNMNWFRKKKSDLVEFTRIWSNAAGDGISYAALRGPGSGIADNAAIALVFLNFGFTGFYQVLLRFTAALQQGD
jgi:hypothetical protein